MLKKSNLNDQILKYFLIFSISILAFLWTFQVLFLDSFYKKEKTNDIKKVASIIKENQNSSDFNQIINDLSFEKEVCISITDENYSLYDTSFLGKGCMREEREKEIYMNDFINNNINSKSYEIINKHFNS